jgi:phosphatidylinositol alpha-1,6-mannosyltransferase
LTIAYLSPGLFDMGGIARYGRYQVKALRSIVGERSVFTLSMLSPQPGGFDEPFPVDAVAGGNGISAKLSFTLAAANRVRRDRIFWAGHLNYAPLVVALAEATGGQAVCNIYGLEVWSNRSRLKARALRRCFVVADCHATRDVAVELDLTTLEHSAVIWDPVDLDVFSPGPADPAIGDRYGLNARSSFRVMFLGRLAHAARHKSPDMLIRAFSRAQLPDDAELVIAGSGDRRNELEALARDCGKGDRIVFTGRVADRDLAALYRHASAFVLVSRRFDGGGEGIPLTPLEAAACGVPIIVGDEDGSREACVDGESGFVVPSRDEDALVDRLERLAADSKLRASLGAAAADRMRRNFSFERFVDEHATVIGQLSRQATRAAQPIQ